MTMLERVAEHKSKCIGKPTIDYAKIYVDELYELCEAFEKMHDALSAIASDGWEDEVSKSDKFDGMTDHCIALECLKEIDK